MRENTTTLKTLDGMSREFRTDSKGRYYIDFIDDYFSEVGWDWVTPDGFEVDEVVHTEKDDTFSWHETPKRLYFRALPPPVEPDTAPLTHRLDLTRFTKEG